MLIEGNLIQLHLSYPPFLACEEAPDHFPTPNQPLGFRTTEPYLHRNKIKNKKKRNVRWNWRNDSKRIVEELVVSYHRIWQRRRPHLWGGPSWCPRHPGASGGRACERARGAVVEFPPRSPWRLLTRWIEKERESREWGGWGWRVEDWRDLPIPFFFPSFFL